MQEARNPQEARTKAQYESAMNTNPWAYNAELKQKQRDDAAKAAARAALPRIASLTELIETGLAQNNPNSTNKSMAAALAEAMHTSSRAEKTPEEPSDLRLLSALQAAAESSHHTVAPSER
jgi:hypothetical protein